MGPTIPVGRQVPLAAGLPVDLDSLLDVERQDLAV
jgi:hypothetical protein